MTHHTDAERALANLRHLYQQMAGGQVKDSAQAKRIADGLLSPAIAKLEQAARRAPAAPVPQVSIEKLEDWKRRVNTLATCGLKADRYRVGSALKQDIADAIAAAPQPPEATVNQQLTVEAAPVQLPEPQAEIEVRSMKTYLDLSIHEWRDTLPDGAYNIYTEQQVRELLANHGIQERST